MYTLAHTHVHAHMYTHTYVHVFIHGCMHASMHACIILPRQGCLQCNYMHACHLRFESIARQTG